MEKGVCVRICPRAKRIILLALFLVVVLSFSQSAFAVLITPQNIELEDFSSTQEQVVTVINDQFEPIACEMHLNYLSLYVEDFVVFEPERFILQPGEQKNVKLVTSFPSDLPPQTHNIVVLSSKTNKKNSTLSFRPVGQKRSELKVVNGAGNETISENSEDIIVSLQLVNEGNTILFVTPTLQIKQNNNLIKEIIYPQSLVILAGESYPLTLRQDTSELEEGKYQVVVQALYHDNEEKFFSEDFQLQHEVKKIEFDNHKPSQQKNIIIGLIIGALGTITFIWFKPKHHSSSKKNSTYVREVHLTNVHDVRHEIHRLKKDISSLTKEVSEVVNKAEQIKKDR